jgi:diguanylate cyclase (GGDEF)-like protein
VSTLPPWPEPPEDCLGKDKWFKRPLKAAHDEADDPLMNPTPLPTGPPPVGQERRSGTRILVFTCSVWLAAVVVAVSLAGGGPPATGFFSSAWGIPGLAALFALSELMVVHFQVGRSAHTVSLVELALVVSLFSSSSVNALVAHVIGCGLVLGFHRHQRSMKLLFNLGMFALENQLAWVVFRLLGPQWKAGGPLSFRSWPAAFAATGAFTVTGIVLVFAVIYLAEDELSFQDLLSTIRTSFITSTVMASIGIAASTLLAVSPPATVLLSIPIIGAYATNQTFLRERRRNEELEFLRQSSSKLSGDDVAEQTLWGVLEAARIEFRVESLEYEHKDPDGSWRRVSFQRGRLPEPIAIGHSSLAEHCPSAATLIQIDTVNPVGLARELAARDIQSVAIVAPVKVRGEIGGVLMISQPSTKVASFGPDDIRLADVLASQLSSAVENGRLGRSVSELRSLESQLVFELQHDSLTGLLNRAAFVRRVREIIGRSSQSHVSAVIFIDLDDFKPINDIYGHAAGDLLLKTIATRIQEVIRPQDLASRLGGDEFAVCLSRIANREEAADAAERILATLQNTMTLPQGDVITPGASVGVAVTFAEDTVESVLDRADVAMLRAKKHGKGNVEVVDPTMDETIKRAYELELDLRGAVARNELDLVFQSVHQLDTFETVAYECLVRWNHPERGVLGPDQFMPSGLRPEVQREVRRFVSAHASRALESLVTAGYRGRVSINIGAGQALDDTLVDDLSELLKSSTLGPNRLLIEIAESAFQRSPETMLLRTDEIRLAGAGVVLDDFGLDVLTLGLIERLRPTQVKLSRELVGGLITRPGAQPLVRSLAELGRAIGFDVVVKGVEDEASAALAINLGCQFGQGYFFARPVDLNAILPILSSTEAADALSL